MTAQKPPAGIIARAGSLHVVVVGGGVSGLVAARECAKVGMRVTLLEAEEALGGAIRSAELDGVRLDAGAESYATRGGHVRALVEELGLGSAIVAPDPGGAWLAGIPGGEPAPLPKGGILGIPANPFQPDVRRILGWSGTWRAWTDRIRPPLTIGHQHSLGALVTKRLGRRVRDRLVAPVTTGVYSALPEDIDTDAAAPGLNAALTRAGSLSGAVDDLLAERADRVGKAPGSAVEGLDGGMGLLVDALAADLAGLGVAIRTSTPVRALRRDGEGWTVVADAPAVASPDEDPPVPADAPEGDAGVPAAEEELRADAVIIATTEPSAFPLLAPHAPGLGEPGPSPRIEVITLLLDAAVLDAAPRGTGVLTVPGSFTAKALTHATVKWDWLRRAAGTRHVVRVSFGAQGEEPATTDLDDDAAALLALREAGALLGVPLPESALLAAHRERFTQSQPAAVIGAAERRSRARAAIRGVDGILAVGAWLAGTGLAQVVPDTLKETERLRRRLLWGGEEPEASRPVP